MYHDRLYLETPYQGAVDHDAVIRTATTQYAAERLHSYQPPFHPNESAQIVLTTGKGDKLTAYVHPGSYAILGTVNENWRLMNIARDIHRGLMLGTPGRVITELAACWLIIMIGTGVYLWWPRGDKKRGTFIPNTHTTGRKLWREFHAVPGAWASIWILALLLTGLPWSILWGGLLSDISHKAGEGFPKAIFKERPFSASDRDLPEISMNTLIATARAKGVWHGFKMDYPWWEKGSYALMPLRHGGKPQEVSYLFFDRRSGEILDSYHWQDLGKVGRLTSLGVAFHEGRLFGRANQWLNLAAVLILISLCITGPILWWKRKPARVLGAPRVQGKVKLPKALIALIVMTGIMLPLFGISVILIVLGEIIIAKMRKNHALS